MTISDWAIVLATFFGPIAAVQVQRIVDGFREKGDRRLAIYRTLMATRLSILSPDHVNALNAIPIDFHGDRKIMDLWEEYYEHMAKDTMDQNLWGQKRAELFVALISEIGKRLRYDFNNVDLQKIYSPKAHGAIEKAQLTIIDGLASILEGKRHIKMDVMSFPVNASSDD